MRRFFILIASLLAATAQAAQPVPDSPGPNTSITRWAAGAYVYQTIKDKRVRGTERWHLNVHADGTRTMTMFNDLFARNGQITAVLRVAKDFRPLESYVSVWNNGQFKGSGLYVVKGGTVEAVIDGPQGRTTQTVSVPQNFSLGTNPVAADGWHAWYYDRAKGGEQPTLILSVEASADMTQPPILKPRNGSYVFVGREKITVPAGTFETDHYRAGDGEVWIAGPDSINVRWAFPGRDLEYVLTEYEARENR
jgi:hypothetical protein